MTDSRSFFATAVDDKRCLDTNLPRFSKAVFCGIRIVVLGLVLSVSASEVEKTAAMKVERCSDGSAVDKASVGGVIGREMK